jgi:hypothetical protein
VAHGEKIETLMGEFRILVPALGALFGFQLVVAFQQSFPELPAPARVANFVGVLCTALALLFLLLPAGYHRFTPRLDNSQSFLVFAQRMFSVALGFVPLSLALSVYVQGVRTFGGQAWPAGMAAALLAALVAGWWVVPWRRARRVERQPKGKGSDA